MFETISMPEFEQLIKKKSVSIIDVREAHEYEQGHIADVLFIPMQSIPEQLDTLDYEENYYKGKKVEKGWCRNYRGFIMYRELLD